MNDFKKIKTQKLSKTQFFYIKGSINSKIISARARKLLVKILQLQPYFTEKVRLSTIGCKNFANRFRENFI